MKIRDHKMVLKTLSSESWAVFFNW